MGRSCRCIRPRYVFTGLGRPVHGNESKFTTGCGIGVLLRMFWVLSVLAYRTIRGEREDSQVHEYIILDQDMETVFVAPPEYSDQKQAIIEDQKHQVNT